MLLEADKLLTSLAEEKDRERVLAFLIDKHAPMLRIQRPAPSTQGRAQIADLSSEDSDGESLAVGAKAQRFLRSVNVPPAKLELVFERTGAVVNLICGTLPGDAKPLKTRNGYLLEGLRAFLETDVATVDAVKARDVVESHGALNKGNHASYVANGLKGFITGDPKSTCTLTTPGLKEAAALVAAYES